MGLDWGTLAFCLILLPYQCLGGQEIWEEGEKRKAWKEVRIY
jgi:hypothetical protein